MTAEILDSAKHVIGSRYVESVKPYILELTGLQRAVRDDEMATKEMATDRVFIAVDDAGNIADLYIS
ncbi:hypothetical protein ACSMEV_03195 [Pseudomonas sp. MLB6B]